MANLASPALADTALSFYNLFIYGCAVTLMLRGLSLVAAASHRSARALGTRAPWLRYTGLAAPQHVGSSRISD